MKKLPLIFFSRIILVIITWMAIPIESHALVSPGAYLYYTNNNNNIRIFSTSTTTIQVCQEQGQLQETFLELRYHVDAALPPARSARQKIFVELRHYTDTVLQSIKNARQKIFWSALGLTYAGTVIYFVRGRLLLNNTHAWHAWHSEISMNEFLAIPHKILYEQLRFSMQERYHTPHSLIAMNLNDFFQETARELGILNGYYTYGSYLARVWISPIFFITQSSLKRAEEKIKRLLHMRTVIACELEPTDVLRRLDLIKCACVS